MGEGARASHCSVLSQDKFPTTTLPGSAGTGEPKDKIAICLGE